MNDDRRFYALVGGLVLLVLAGVVLRYRRMQEAPAHRPATATSHPKAEPEAAEPAPAPTPAAMPDDAQARAHAEARRARDAMRADILAALRRRDAGAPVAQASTTPENAAAAPGGEPPRGRYDPSYIQEHFREDMFPILRQCYGAALKRQPALHGRLVLKFSIVGDPQVGGVVEDASIDDESDLKDTEMETCARESLMALTFDKPPTGGGLVTVTYPVLFAPGEEEGDAAP
jgi:hypothetical protein